MTNRVFFLLRSAYSASDETRYTTERCGFAVAANDATTFDDLLFRAEGQARALSRNQHALVFPPGAI